MAIPVEARKTIAPPRSTSENNWQERALRTEALMEDALKELEYVKAQVRLLTAKRFGASRERTPQEQPSLFESVFNEAEATYEPFTPEPDLTEVKGYQRKKRKGQRDELLQGYNTLMSPTSLLLKGHSGPLSRPMRPHCRS